MKVSRYFEIMKDRLRILKDLGFEREVARDTVRRSVSFWVNYPINDSRVGSYFENQRRIARANREYIKHGSVPSQQENFSLETLEIFPY